MNRTEAINALRHLIDLHSAEQEGLAEGMPTPEEWIDAVDDAHDAVERLINGAAPPWKPEKPFFTFSELRQAIFDKEERWAFYSTNTFWWTHDLGDLKQATEMGMQRQNESHERMMADPKIPKEHKEKMSALMDIMRKGDHRTPLDPTGSPLMQMPLKDWVRNAELRPSIYGRHQLEALMAAHHRNCVQGEQVMAVAEWETYNKMIDLIKGVDHPEQMRIVYIAHPISGDPKGNLEKINAIVREINLNEPNVVPLVPYYADILALDDDIPEERHRGIRNDIAVIKSGAIHELRLYGPRISNGMKAELDLAMAINIPVEAMTPETENELNSIIQAQKEFDEGDSSLKIVD